jgi:hypothetical protein
MMTLNGWLSIVTVVRARSTSADTAADRGGRDGQRRTVHELCVSCAGQTDRLARWSETTGAAAVLRTAAGTHPSVMPSFIAAFSIQLNLAAVCNLRLYNRLTNDQMVY